MIANVEFGGPRAPFALALTSGVITAFNPCGFAMLPAYVSVFVGRSETEPGSTARRLLRAAATGTIVTLGFMSVFGAIGLLTTQLLSTITDFVPYISMIVGTFLALLGVAMWCGFEPKMSFFTVRSAQHGRTWPSMYLYGVSYALVSLSCGFARFLTTVVAASRESSFVSSMRIYTAFTTGMGLVLVVLSVAASTRCVPAPMSDGSDSVAWRERRTKTHPGGSGRFSNGTHRRTNLPEHHRSTCHGIVSGAHTESSGNEQSCDRVDTAVALYSFVDVGPFEGATSPVDLAPHHQPRVAVHRHGRGVA